MTETLHVPDAVDDHLYNRHFLHVAKRLGLKNETGQYGETRNEHNPDLVILIVGFGEKVRRVRWQCAKRIAGEPAIQQMFCNAIPEGDVHGTAWRVGQRKDISRKNESRLVKNLVRHSSQLDPFTVRYGEKWKVGDAVMSELTAEDDPVRVLRDMVSEALVDSELEPCSGDFTPHSSDRYAEALPLDRMQEVQDFIQEGYEVGEIQPTEFEVVEFVVAENWPEYRPQENFGTYRYKPIAKIALGHGALSHF